MGLFIIMRLGILVFVIPFVVSSVVTFIELSLL